MGIRGAWSLISKDPRRYGRPWTLGNHDDGPTAETLLFLDGPSLLYHIAITDAYDSPSSVTEANARGSSSVISPDIIYRRTTNFISSLLASGGDSIEVHIVMDGLAPTSKIPTQLSRLSTVARECEMIAVSHGKNAHSKQTVLHIFAEAAMIEALADLMKRCRSLHLHHPHHGEAEAFVAQWLNQSQPVAKEVVIFTDDTDFLVYPSCPGLVPFRTLQFQPLSGKTRLTGFQYLRSKFLASFLSSGGSDDRVMTAIVALAGCDYVLSPDKESILQRARTFIVQSNVGGLRQRQRNDPSSSAMLTAILRFVAYHYTRTKSTQRSDSDDNGHTLWLCSLASAVCGRGKGHEERIDKFLESLDEIHNIYVPPQETDNRACLGLAQPLMWTEFCRLVECGVLFCRPVVETWGGDNCKSSRKRKPKRSKHHRKKRQVEQGDNTALDEKSCRDNPPLEGIISMPPAPSTVSSWIAKGSIWKLPHFCHFREQLYSILYQRASSTSDATFEGMHFHPIWTSSHRKVTEFLRVGTTTSVDFVDRTVTVPTDSECSEFDGSLAGTTKDSALRNATSNVISFCMVGEKLRHSFDESTLMSVPEKHLMLFLSSLLLPVESALLLLLVGTCPEKMLSTIPVLSISEEAMAARNKSLSLITVACFHAALATNVALSLAAVNCRDKPLNECGAEVIVGAHKVFGNDTIMLVWETLRNENYESDLEQLVSEELIHSFFQRLHIQKGQMEPVSNLGHDFNSSLEHWQKESFGLWKKWCEIAKIQHD